MKFRVQKGALHTALATAVRAVGSSISQQILMGLCLRLEGNRLSVAGTDLGLTLRSDVEVVGLTDGASVAPGKLIVDVVKSLPDGAVTLVADESEKRLVVEAGRSRFSLTTFDANLFPEVFQGDIDERVEVPVGELGGALRQVTRFASLDESRPLLTGVLVTSKGESLRFVATDSYRLSVRDIVAKGFAKHKELLVPARGMAELAQVSRSVLSGSGTFMFGAGDRWVSAEAGPIELMARTMTGEYPNYSQLFPESFGTVVTIDKAVFAASVKRISLLSGGEKTMPLILELQSDAVEVSGSFPENGNARETVEAKVSDGEGVGRVAFNPKYLLEGLEALGGDTVTLLMKTSNAPVEVTDADSTGYRHLIMPVRIP